jgi:hypothetical protein
VTSIYQIGLIVATSHHITKYGQEPRNLAKLTTLKVCQGALMTQLSINALSRKKAHASVGGSFSVQLSPEVVWLRRVWSVSFDR